MVIGDRMGYNQQCDMLVLRSWSCPSKWTDFCTELFLIWETKNGSTLKMRILTSKLRNLWCQMMSNVKNWRSRTYMCVDLNGIVFLLGPWLALATAIIPVAPYGHPKPKAWVTLRHRQLAWSGALRPCGSVVSWWLQFHWGETMGPTGPTHLGMKLGYISSFGTWKYGKCGKVNNFGLATTVGTSTYHVFLLPVIIQFILIFGQEP